MKASVYRKYGPPEVLHIEDMDKPVPKSNELLIRNSATSATSGDWHMRKADPWIVRLFAGLTRPKKPILGFVISGVVESAGKDVKRFKEGDQVYGTAGMAFGAYAEYVCLPETGVLAKKPENLTFEEAAAIPFGGNTALYFLRKGKIAEGQKVLIYGASGAIGTAAVQLAKHFGADVTGVCGTANLNMVTALGADRVIDYTREDFSRNGESYDIIFDTVGKSDISKCLGSLKEKGVLLLAAAGPSQMIRGLWTTLTGGRKVVSGVMSETAEDLAFFNELIRNSKIKPVIDRCYPLEEAAEAHRYVEEGHKKGNVIITISKSGAI